MFSLEQDFTANLNFLSTLDSENINFENKQERKKTKTQNKTNKKQNKSRLKIYSSTGAAKHLKFSTIHLFIF